MSYAFSVTARPTERTTTPSCGDADIFRARSIQRGTSIVFAKTRTRSGSAPRATIELRAAVPTTRTPAAPRTIGGTTVPFSAFRHAGRGPRSWLSTRSTYGTRCARHHAIAACEGKVLQPETTTTPGRAFRSARAIPGVTG